VTGGRAKRSLSQNFLVDPNLRRKIVGELGMRAVDQVLEIGPGHGELSDLIAGHVARLVLVEKDDDLAGQLASRFAAVDSVTIVHADALDVDLQSLLEPDRPALVVSNVPYGITSPLLFRFLDLRPFPRRLVLLVQREVAERIAAPPGSKAYGALSVGVQSRGSARLAFRVGRKAFRPVPDVESALLVIEPRRPGPSAQALEDLRILTRTAFSRRRKQLKSILRSSAEHALPEGRLEDVLGDLGISPRARPETLSPQQFMDLAAALRAAAGVRPDDGHDVS